MWESGQTPRGKTHRSVGMPPPPCPGHDSGSLEFLTIRLAYMDPSAIYQLQFRFWFFLWFPLVSHCSGKSSLPLFTCLSLHSWGQPFALCPHLSYRFRKTCWFFSLLSFFLLDRMEWWLPSPLYMEPETGSLFASFLYVFVSVLIVKWSYNFSFLYFLHWVLVSVLY